METLIKSWCKISACGLVATLATATALGHAQRNPAVDLAQPNEQRVAQFSAHGTVFRDCSDCPEMVVIPPGNFMMGSPDSELGHSDREGPVHSVAIPDVFGVGRFEVTKAQFARFVRESGYLANNGCYGWNGKTWVIDSSNGWRNPGFPQTDDEPVVCVDWHDATAYTQWLSNKTGGLYRLLTEAEWEYAARAGTSQTSHPWGDNPNEACHYANVADASAWTTLPGWSKLWIYDCNDGHVFTAPVGSYQPNAFGLYDMIGNVWEWIEDCWNETYAQTPSNGTAPTMGDCNRRVLRGASWGNGPSYARSAFRNKDSADFRVNSLGFRVATTK